MKNPIKFHAMSLATLSLIILGATLSALAAPRTTRARTFDDVDDVQEPVGLQEIDQNSDDSEGDGNQAAATNANRRRQADVLEDQVDADEEDDTDSAASDMSQEALARLAGQWNFPGGHNQQVVEHQSSELDGDSNLPLETNIESAKLDFGGHELMTAAGHHHHHKHYPHGKMEMGAHTSKKGAFGWHSKHPVGGKGR